MHRVDHAISRLVVAEPNQYLIEDDVVHHLEWSLPDERPFLAQGSIAGVPAKLWLSDDGRVLLLTATAYADELAGRLR